MFKKYRFVWNGKDGNKHSVDFLVHSKISRRGFVHRACVLGQIPRIDDMDNDWSKYRENEDLLFGKRVTKVSYCNRTWECYPGQTCLSNLWKKLAKLKFIDMGRICEVNPFSEDKEPDHENLMEPDELFARFSR